MPEESCDILAGNHGKFVLISLSVYIWHDIFIYIYMLMNTDLRSIYVSNWHLHPPMLDLTDRIQHNKKHNSDIMTSHKTPPWATWILSHETRIHMFLLTSVQRCHHPMASWKVVDVCCFVEVNFFRAKERFLKIQHQISDEEVLWLLQVLAWQLSLPKFRSGENIMKNFCTCGQLVGAKSL